MVGNEESRHIFTVSLFKGVHTDNKFLHFSYQLSMVTSCVLRVTSPVAGFKLWIVLLPRCCRLCYYKKKGDPGREMGNRWKSPHDKQASEQPALKIFLDIKVHFHLMTDNK